MARTWMILARVIRVAQAQAQAQGQAQAAGHGQAAAMLLAVAAQNAVLAAVAEALQAGHEQAAVVEAAVQAVQAVIGEAEEDAAQVQHAAAVAAAVVAVARAELEGRVVRVDAVPAEDAAAANNLGQPDFTVSVEPPPRVTFLTARIDLDSFPDDLRTDRHPYIVSAGPFALLAHVATDPYFGTDFRQPLIGTRLFRRHHVVVRYFRRVGGEIAATAARVPARPRSLPLVPALRNIASVCLVCDGYGDRRTYNFRIAELMVNTSPRHPSLELAIFRSDRGRWFSPPVLTSPLKAWDPYRKWVPHGAVAVDSTVFWFDLSWGILYCDVQDEPEDLHVLFYRPPRHRALPRGKATGDIHNKRCIAVSRDILRYIEIIPDPANPNGEAARVCMWSLAMGGNGWRWIANFSVSFQDIWNHNTYAPTGLQHEVPVLVGVCPANPDVLYFELHNRLFGVNIPERSVVDYEANEHELVNVPGPGVPQPQTGSSRYLLTWNLLRPGRDSERFIGHVSPDLPDDGFPDDPKDEEPQDPRGKSKGKSKASDGRRKSSSASSRPSKALRIK